MRRRVAQSWIAVAGLAVASGCAHGPQTAEALKADAASYYPLAVGNRWIYSVNALGEHHSQTVQIVREDAGKFVDGDGNELTVDAFGVRDAKRYLLREPIETGREWTNVVSVSSVEHFRVIDAGTPCDAPAGKFANCVRVQDKDRVDKDTTLTVEWTFAKGVGLIRVETTLEAKGKAIPQAQLLLESYQLASAK